jgi:acetyltransferase-like isoleucine patch superfamily enzyme
MVFVSLFCLALAGAIAFVRLLGELGSFGAFRGIVLAIGGLIGLYVCALLVFRLFMRLFPLHVGEIPHGSRQEFIYHVYLLFFLILFYPVMRSGSIPVPLMRVFYLALGAKLGTNTYSSGIILDPHFVTIGDNTIVGQFALLVPHVIEGSKLAHYPIEIGSNVTIGAHAVVLSDVSIGDNAIVATGAIVPKGTRIAKGETWGGVPARRISRAD